jgi:hypothetical protein
VLLLLKNRCWALSLHDANRRDRQRGQAVILFIAGAQAITESVSGQQVRGTPAPGGNDIRASVRLFRVLPALSNPLQPGAAATRPGPADRATQCPSHRDESRAMCQCGTGTVALAVYPAGSGSEQNSNDVKINLSSGRNRMHPLYN